MLTGRKQKTVTKHSGSLRPHNRENTTVHTKDRFLYTIKSVYWLLTLMIKRM